MLPLALFGFAMSIPKLEVVLFIILRFRRGRPNPDTEGLAPSAIGARMLSDLFLYVLTVISSRADLIDDSSGHAVVELRVIDDHAAFAAPG